MFSANFGGIGLLLALLSSCAAGQTTNLSPSEKRPAQTSYDLALILMRVEAAQSLNRTIIPYRVVRKYLIFPSKNPDSTSEVVAEVDFQPPASKKYVIQRMSGSKHAEEAVRRILDREVEASSHGRQLPTAALLAGNYDFTYLGEDSIEGHPCFLLGLKPKRMDKNLISGRGWVDQRSFLIRQVEGDLVQSPTWWVRNVHVRLVFDDVEGTWMQTYTKAIADVRVLGSQTLTSQIIEYRSQEAVTSAIRASQPVGPR